LPDTDSGWATFRSMGRSKEAGIQKHMKLLNPRAEVQSVLDMVGFSAVFEVFNDLDTAVKSF
jgi:tRNA A37 threonylcarbamoyladenosine dehydratase